VCQRFRVSEIVDRYEIYVTVPEGGPEDVAADAAKSVNADFDTHF
jgi:hypothetical protein